MKKEMIYDSIRRPERGQEEKNTRVGEAGQQEQQAKKGLVARRLKGGTCDPKHPEKQEIVELGGPPLLLLSLAPWT